jgi:hypothetical protein
MDSSFQNDGVIYGISCGKSTWKYSWSVDRMQQKKYIGFFIMHTEV